MCKINNLRKIIKFIINKRNCLKVEVSEIKGLIDKTFFFRFSFVFSGIGFGLYCFF